jgi:hypothetical protein
VEVGGGEGRVDLEVVEWGRVVDDRVVWEDIVVVRLVVVVVVGRGAEPPPLEPKFQVPWMTPRSCEAK